VPATFQWRFFLSLPFKNTFLVIVIVLQVPAKKPNKLNLYHCFRHMQLFLH
jgi:hypothetical protein